MSDSALKPTGIILGVDDRPGWGVLFLLACQHVIIPISYSVFAVVAVRAAGGTPVEIERVTTMALLAAAVGVTLQGLKRGPIGSGYLAAHISSFIYLPASLAAGALGGLPLIWGMTLVAGLFEAALSRVFHLLKSVFPPVVCGVVVTMVGFSMVNVAMERFLGMDQTDHICTFGELSVSGLTLVCLIVLSLLSKSKLRLFSLLLSLMVGYLAAWALGLVGEETTSAIERASWLALPDIGHAGWKFDSRLLAPFLVAGLAAAVKTSGLIITSQRINDPDWQEPDMKNVGRGVLADALGTVTSGLLGTIGTNLSPTSVGLTSSTGATSRYIGFAVGLLVAASAFLPKITVFISTLPVPVMGAVLVYAVCIISGSGLKLIFSEPWNLQRTFLVGISFLVGLSVEVNPHLYHQLPGWLQLIFDSPITMSALAAIGLNLAFKLKPSRGD